MSDTPRTDHEADHPQNVLNDYYRAKRLGVAEEPEVVPAALARAMERELNLPSCLLDVNAICEQRDELLAWKESAMAVENEWDLQLLAKTLGVRLGQSCRKGIAEAIPRLIAERNGLLVQNEVATTDRAEWKMRADRLAARVAELEEALELCYDHFRDYYPALEGNNVGIAVRAVLAKGEGGAR